MLPHGFHARASPFTIMTPAPWILIPLFKWNPVGVQASIAEVGGGVLERMSIVEKLVWVGSVLGGPRSWGEEGEGAEGAFARRVSGLDCEGMGWEGVGFWAGGVGWKRRARRWGEGRMGVVVEVVVVVRVLRGLVVVGVEVVEGVR